MRVGENSECFSGGGGVGCGRGRSEARGRARSLPYLVPHVPPPQPRTFADVPEPRVRGERPGEPGAVASGRHLQEVPVVAAHRCRQQREAEQRAQGSDQEQRAQPGHAGAGAAEAAAGSGRSWEVRGVREMRGTGELGSRSGRGVREASGRRRRGSLESTESGRRGVGEQGGGGALGVAGSRSARAVRMFVRIFQARRPHRLAVPLGFAGKWTPPRCDGQLAPPPLPLDARRTWVQVPASPTSWPDLGSLGKFCHLSKPPVLQPPNGLAGEEDGWGLKLPRTGSAGCSPSLLWELSA